MAHTKLGIHRYPTLISLATVVYATTDAERDRTMIDEVFIGDVDCDGSETLLIGCDPIYEGVPIGCDDGNFAGAVCQKGQIL